MVDPLLVKYGTSRNGHSIFAPSSSASWLNCSGSLLVNAKAKDSAGYEAAEGTVAHSVAEEWAKTGKKPDHRIGRVEHALAGGREHAVEVTSEMLYHVGRFVEWCVELPGDHFFEQHVDLSELMPIPDQGGTSDHFACERGLLTITDLKYGTGIRVYAEGNTQALLYAAGAFLAWDWIYGFRRIIIRICQPRLDVFETWEISREQLLAFMGEVKVEARAAWIENAPRSPSPKACQWCAGFETCPARLKHLDDIIDDTFEVEDDPGMEVTFSHTYEADALQNHPQAMAELARAVRRAEDSQVRELSTRALAYALGYRASVEKWFKSIAETLLERAEQGEPIPYWKLTEGRKRRQWKDQSEAVSALEAEFGISRDRLMPPKLLSPKQVEGVIRAEVNAKPVDIKRAMGKLIHTVQNKRSLVPLNDDRPDADELLDGFEGEDDDE